MTHNYGALRAVAVAANVPTEDDNLKAINHEAHMRFQATFDPPTVLALLDERERYEALVKAVKTGHWNEAARLAAEGDG